MNNFKRGTPAFGLFLGTLFLLAGALILWIGIWKTLLLTVLFAAGYFIGAVSDKPEFIRSAVGKVVPEKSEKTIDFRKEIEREQVSEFRKGQEEGKEHTSEETMADPAQSEEE